jgi:hypothetical protein
VDQEATVMTAADRIGIEREKIGRVLKIANSTIQRIVAVDEKLTSKAEFRIELVPIMENYRFVNWGVVFQNTLHIVTFGAPFLFAVGEDEELESVRARLGDHVKQMVDQEPFEITVTSNGNRKIDESCWKNGTFCLTICLQNIDVNEIFEPCNFFRRVGVKFLNS